MAAGEASAYQVALNNGFSGTQAQWLSPLVGATGSTGATGPTGSTGPQGPTGATGSIPVYNSAGLITGAKIWIGTATTNSSGAWSVNYSSAGFTSAPSVQAQAISTSTSTANAVSTTQTAPTSTSVSGAAFVPNAISLLGLLPLQTVGAGTVIQVMAIGS
jgi:hypothetical protein